MVNNPTQATVEKNELNGLRIKILLEKKILQKNSSALSEMRFYGFIIALV